jgi:Uma2 family endonuclease
VEVWCIDRGIELTPYGSWTLKKRAKQRGAEPDECYIFGTEPREEPQLAIEVEWTRAGLNKLDVYRKLGVAEVWYWRKGIIEVHLLRGDVYERVQASGLLPDLDLVLLASFLDRTTLTQAVRDFRAALLKA